MISRVWDAPGGRSFSATIKYIRGLGKDFEPHEKVEYELTRNVDDINTAIEEMEFVESTGKSAHAAYHFGFSWREGEKPTREEIEACFDHALKALGMEDLQAVAGFHRDTDNYHLHICINRIDYRTGHVRPIDKDRMKLDKACREMELQHGFERDNGSYMINDKGEIVKKSHDPDRPFSLDQGNRRREIETGEKSFKTWAKERAGKDLTAALADGSWDDLHRAAAKYNLDIRPDPKNQGLVIVDRNDPDQYHAKASEIARQLSRGRLEKALGPYQEPTARVKDLAPVIDYKSDTEKMIAVEPEQKQLYREFKDYQEEWKHHAEERKAITAELTAGRKEIIEWKKEQVKALKESDLPGIEKRAQRAAINLGAARRKAEIEDRAAEKRAALGEFGEAKKGWDKYLVERANKGNEAAIYMLRQKKNRLEVEAPEPGTTGEEEAAKKTPLTTLKDLEIKVSRHGNVSFLDKSGAEAYRDTGRQLLFLGHSKNDPAAIKAGLLLSQEKFGRSFELTGSTAWKRLAAAEAVKLGIEITNKELQPYIAELKKAQGIGQQIKGRELLPEIRDEIKIITAKIDQGEKWLAEKGQIDGKTDARRVAEQTATKGISEAIKKERTDLDAEALKLATDMAGGKVSTINREELTARLATNEVNTARLHSYLERPEVQKQVQAEEAKINAVDQETREARAYRADLKKIEKTLAADPKKDRAYKLEPGTDPRDRRQIVKDIQQQINRVQKDIDRGKGMDR
ncbi:Relaxase/mobilization nuclease family protein [Geobacter metallireducens RCH3]|uniref:Relaxase/mobilization nuclease domain protein MobA n=2 Tax=Geobacter metallireducens TaxID=28232 RepID=Q39PP5_GEOMG|nr:relaxase/mobilization nuclease domain protein MobA [Geobacter metallireducens GS-15]EHP83953.1 Relaxase/mobilization nuclease family protein [Geobacter metallireducens RCH3]